MGTTVSAASTVFACTTALTRTSPCPPKRAPGKTAQPVARKQPSSPIRAGCAARPRTRAFSITAQRLPTRTSPFSAVSTAPKSTLASAPTRTFPHSTAVGAT
ncbi:hypothetical protein LCL61_18900 [Amycolatopsis coloradensis]|uniref:Uncharacterized protein n=1 Tax=Amycolatopsis coloradensis TaxID=76021 RepID=A0ACD5BE34_9PSEU